MTAQDAPRVHPTAIIDSTAETDSTVEIGPYCLVGPHCILHAGVRLYPHAMVLGWTELGEGCQVFPGAMLGGAPQDRKYKDEVTYLRVGPRTQIRECVTVHRASGDGEATIIGHDSMIMAYAHIGHNCHIGSNVTLANNAGISGHILIEDYANIGGYVGVHQYARIGTLAMIGGMSKVVRDIPPYALADGRPAQVIAVNSVGLRRAGISEPAQAALKEAYRIIYRSGLNLSHALARVREEVDQCLEVERLVDFLEEVFQGYGGRARDPRGRAT